MFKTNIFYLNKKVVLDYLFILIFLYFAFHLIYGNRGLLAYFKYNKELEVLTAELDDTKSQRLDIEHRVKSLRTESLDKDILDEEARKTLGFTSDGEKIFVPDKENRE
jgi:cell division protein FtsB